jgi:cell division protease FtsH
VSDRTRELRDEEQQALADEGMRLAQQILHDHRATLEQFAHQLLAEETLERADIDRIMAGNAAAASGRRGAHAGLRVVAAEAPDPRTAEQR